MHISGPQNLPALFTEAMDQCLTSRLAMQLLPEHALKLKFAKHGQGNAFAKPDTFEWAESVMKSKNLKERCAAAFHEVIHFVHYQDDSDAYEERRKNKLDKWLDQEEELTISGRVDGVKLNEAHVWNLYCENEVLKELNLAQRDRYFSVPKHTKGHYKEVLVFDF